MDRMELSLNLSEDSLSLLSPVSAPMNTKSSPDSGVPLRRAGTRFFQPRHAAQVTLFQGGLTSAVSMHSPIQVSYASRPESILCPCLREAEAAPELELLKAAVDGRLDIVKWLIRNNVVSPEATSRLSDHIHLAQCSDDDGAKPIGSKKMHPGPGWPAICAAACKGHHDIVAFLLESGCAPNVMTVESETRTHVQYFPLYLACARGHESIVRLLLQHRHRFDINQVQQQGYNAVIGACMMGNDNPTILRLVIEAGGNVNHLDPKGGSALFLCAQHGRPDLMEILFQFGADPNPAPTLGHTMQRRRNSSPIHIATSRNHALCVALLLEHGAVVDDRIASSGATALILAAYSGFGETLEILLAHGASVGEMDFDGRTALHKAAERNHTKIIETLIQRGACIDAEDAKGDTPLICAIRDFNVEAVHLLLQQGADPNFASRVRDLTTLEVLFCSSWAHESEDTLLYLVDVLLRSGAAICRSSRNGPTALHSICSVVDRSTSAIQIAQRLLRHGASVMTVDHNGSTPLHTAAGLGRLELVQLFLEHGADPSCRDRMGNSVLMYVCSSTSDVDDSDHLGVAKALVQAGADVNQENLDELSPLLAAMSHDFADITSYLASSMQCDVTSIMSSSKARRLLLQSTFSDIILHALDHGMQNRSRITFLATLYPAFGHKSKIQALKASNNFEIGLLREIVSFLPKPTDFAEEL